LIKIGNIELSPFLIRSASDLIKAFDLIQFSSCQDLKNLPKRADSSLFKLIIENKQKAISELIRFISLLSDSDKEVEIMNGIERAKSKLQELNEH